MMEMYVLDPDGVESRLGAPALGSGGCSGAFAPGLSPAPTRPSSARRMYLVTVTGDTFRLRAIARPLNPATWCSRRTSRTLRMDNPLFATVTPSPKKGVGRVPR